MPHEALQPKTCFNLAIIYYTMAMLAEREIDALEIGARRKATNPSFLDSERKIVAKRLGVFLSIVLDLEASIRQSQA